ncbi:MAG: hypothetical protein QOJ76_271, partial [Acidobacteriota bacterium]|nr:hypothetical protein [Acidobacteriota bacterium]
QNYAVPVRFAYPMLERAGWKLAEPVEEANANTNTSQPPKEARPPINPPR